MSSTDTPMIGTVPSRMGVSFELRDERLVGRLTVTPALAPRGAVSMASVVLLIDALSGYSLPVDAATWPTTSDLSVRLPNVAAPGRIDARVEVLRAGRRTATFEAPLTVDGRLWATGFARFVRIPRQPDQHGRPPPDLIAAALREPMPPIDRPLRDVAGFESTDPANGVVTVELGPHLANTGGSMQGAIVAGLAETAAEDLADHRLGGDRPHVVTQMELRYLAENRRSPVVARAQVVGDPAEGSGSGATVRVDLVDEGGDGQLTTAVLARVEPAPEVPARKSLARS